jgi:RNA polymerase sigma factor (TIGR02999 family)
MGDPGNDVTRALNAIEQSQPRASEQLLPLVYEELRRLAAARMANERPGHTLQPTALVHEAYLRLVGDPSRGWDNRGHFFAAAAEAMRRILIESARRKSALRHGGAMQRVELREIEIAATTKAEELLQVNEALEKFETVEPQKAGLVKLRYFAGLTIAEAGEAAGVSPATAKRWWAYSRAWLYKEMQENG